MKSKHIQNIDLWCFLCNLRTFIYNKYLIKIVIYVGGTNKQQRNNISKVKEPNWIHNQIYMHI